MKRTRRWLSGIVFLDLGTGVDLRRLQIPALHQPGLGQSFGHAGRQEQAVNQMLFHPQVRALQRVGAENKVFWEKAAPTRYPIDFLRLSSPSCHTRHNVAVPRQG
ncbi:MAG: hypothetical protein R3D60_10715 [Paracoccaceae bacterium]